MKVPLIVLTGFLGAGKTSLVNRLIARRAAAGGDAVGKLAIIVNEFGAIGIDADLLPQGAARQVELPGGCVCCVLSDDLDRTVLEILDGNPEVDTIVLETTGVAEPIPIVWTLERPPLDQRVRVAAIVTVVDPLSWPAARATGPVADIQVEGADVVLVSKLDLASPAVVAEVVAELERLAPHAPVLALPAAAAVDWLEAALRDPPERGERGGHADHDHADHDHADHDHADHDHADHDHADHDHGPPSPGARHGYTSAAIPVTAAVDLERFEDAVAALPASYFRVKAIVAAVDPRSGSSAQGWFAVHRVGGRVSSEPVAAPAAGARMVGLGPAVDAAALAATVALAVLGSPGAG